MRLAFVVQRYGEEVTGGAEALCRWVAERMRKYFAVEVLTTCALDYLTWDNHYPPGVTEVNSVVVRRFPTDVSRDVPAFNNFARTLFGKDHRTLVDELTWMRLQGPFSSALLAYIKAHEEQFDLFVFVTYSYLTTYLGLQLAPRKSVLIPAAHDEPHFHFTAFQPIFHLPRGIIYNTPEERRLVQTTWQNVQVPCCIAGVGVSDNPEDASRQADASFRAQLEQFSPYLLYVGRVDAMKGCRELIAYMVKYLEERRANVHLVLAGKLTLDTPEHPQIHATGFVTDAQKAELLRHALIVVNPSEYESLSLLVLEAWQGGIPVVVNGSSDVLVEHCLKSNGGLYYTNYEEFALCVDLLLADQTLRETLGQHGQHYVQQQYSWDTVEKIYVEFFLTMGENPTDLKSVGQ